MSNKSNFKKKHNYYRRDEEEIRIKERKRLPRKLKKQNIYDLLEEEKDLIDFNERPYLGWMEEEWNSRFSG